MAFVHPAACRLRADACYWEGTAFGGISYRVVFTVTKQGIWFWDVTVDSHGREAKIDIIYGQDIGLADIGAVRSNEAYMSQYVDHKAFKDEELGYVLCFRQNQPMQGGAFPYMQHGSLTGADGYSTDGFQFFGISYKETDVPEALGKPELANEVYQYEFGYAALQSELTQLKGEARFVFYGLFKANHPSAVDSLEFGCGSSAALGKRLSAPKKLILQLLLSLQLKLRFAACHRFTVTHGIDDDSGD